MDSEYNIPIIIPAYEPEKKLIDFCRNLKRYNYEVIVIDDGSGETFSGIFERLEAVEGCCVLRHAANLGKGRSLKDAFNYVLLNYENALGVITADSDGQHTIRDIQKCMEALRENPNSLILGCRNFLGDNVPWKSRIGNELTKKVFSFLCGIKVSDTQTGLRGIPVKVMECLLSTPGERFEFETNMLLLCNNKFKISEICIETVYDSKNDHKTHFDPFRDSIMIYRMILSYSLSSIFATIIDFIIFSVVLNIGYNVYIATAIARSVSSIINFTTNRNAVFRVKDNIFKQFGKYATLVIFSGIISSIAINYLQKKLSINVVLIKGMVETVLFFFNYYIQKGVIFVKSKETIAKRK